MAVISLHKIAPFEQLLSRCQQADFIEEAARKNGYVREDLPELSRIAGEVVRESGRKGSFTSKLLQKEAEGKRPVTVSVLTLGEGVDRLQDRYRERENMTAAYMAEVISNEILMKSYEAYDRMLAETTDYRVKEFHFPGSEEAYPLSDIGKILDMLGAPVQCLKSFCMVPRKSVVFYAELTREKGNACRSVCQTCEKRSCPYRREENRKEEQI